MFSLTQKLGPWGLLQISKNPKRNFEAKHIFLTKQSETFEATHSEMKLNFFPRVSREGSETKRNVCVLLSFALKLNFFRSEIGTPYCVSLPLSQGGWVGSLIYAFFIPNAFPKTFLAAMLF